MFDILKADPMYRLLEVVEGNTGFLQRTDAPLIHPESDSWWLQGYNQAYYQQLVSPQPGARTGRTVGSLLRGLTRKLIP